MEPTTDPEKVIKDHPISQIQTYCLACMELSLSIAKTRKQVYYDRDLQEWRVRIVAIDYDPIGTSKICFTSK